MPQCQRASWIFLLQGTLKRKSHHFDDIFATGCTGSCRSTTSSAASDENFIKIAALSFEWRTSLWFTEITDCLGLLHIYFIVYNVDHAGSAICTKRLWSGILHGAEQEANVLNLGQYQASCFKGHRWVKSIEYNSQSQCAVKSHGISVAITVIWEMMSNLSVNNLPPTTHTRLLICFVVFN